MTEAAIGLLLAGLTGLLGGGIGVYFHMRQKKSETAFERRLVWCENALTKFHSAGAAVVSARDLGSVSKELSAACWDDVRECYENLIPIAGQRVLYASLEGDRAISDFMESLESLIDTHLRSPDADTSDKSGICLDRLNTAWVAMSKEARTHLALEPLGSDRPPRFTRSFKAMPSAGDGV